ncbi:Polyketide cyclase / dehydrase and lipid transport [Goodfellowiella coeruleoviolacea]|uniref:Polyketide cyclase / dehydrase and lipid transport n=1 Tax=Goodfellowiella coeruleoviolacea TaxID=334858 RepID=A0AAE3G9G1_9PSEU|nr:Polyketide cyclase / dehydrase and lipid transport [Goodfellowiella coeruleoviolacea]
MVQAPPNQVFAVLADGWSYAGWVVGASHIREVDAEWPTLGSRIHHSIGPWPLQVRDVTVVRGVEPGRCLELQAGMWPFGAARVVLTLEPVGTNTTRVVMGEEFVHAPARLLPRVVQEVLLRPRNTEALARLASLAVRKQSPA